MKSIFRKILEMEKSLSLAGLKEIVSTHGE